MNYNQGYNEHQQYKGQFFKGGSSKHASYRHPHWAKEGMTRSRVRRSQRAKKEVYQTYENRNKPVNVTIKKHGDNKVTYQNVAT